MSNQLNWGILGTGKIADVLAQAIQASSTGKLVAVGSRAQKTADTFGDKYKIPKRYPTYEAMLADPDVHAVYISLPNHLHAEWAIKCAEAKKHILLEKPFALNFAQTMQVLEATRFHNVFLMEAFMYRCHPQTAKLVQLIKEKAIGEVRVIQSNFGFNMGQNLANIRLQNDAGGGALMDVGTYTLSMARLVAGAAAGLDGPAEPTEFKASAHIGSASRVDEWATASLKFPGDILATLVCGNNVGVGMTLTIWGSDGNIVVKNPWFPGRNKGEPGVIELTCAGKDKPEEIAVKSDEALYTVEVDTVARCVAEKKFQAASPCMTWEDSIGNMKGLDAWRAQVGLRFDTESLAATAIPVTNRSLRRSPDAKKMRYGKVAGIDKPVSRLVMGTMITSGDRPAYSTAMLDHFFEIGGNAVDTAYVYGGGKSEREVGRWIRSRNIRNEMFVIAKGAGTVNCTPDLVTREFLESLYRLDIGGADLYMMHRDNTTVPVGEFVDMLNEHVKAGRMKAFGGSNWTWRRIQAANDYAKAKGVMGFSASSPNFSLARWNEPMWSNCESASDPESRAWYEKTQLPLFAWSSQANGFFVRSFDRESNDPVKMWGNSDISRVWFNDDNFERKRRVEELAKKRGVTQHQIALAYVLDQPINIFALIGTQTIEETRTSAEALDVELTPQELKWLNLEA